MTPGTPQERNELQAQILLARGYANYGLGSLHGMRGTSAEAVPYLERAIALLTEHAGPTSPMTLDARR